MAGRPAAGDPVLRALRSGRGSRTGVAGVAAGDEVFALTPFDRDGVAADYTALPAELLVAKAAGARARRERRDPAARAHRLAGAVRPRPARRGRARADPRCRGRRRRVRRAARPRGRRARDRDRIGGEPGIGPRARRTRGRRLRRRASRTRSNPSTSCSTPPAASGCAGPLAVLRAGGRLVSVAEEPPDGGVYFVVEPNRDQLTVAREAGRCRRAAARVRRGLPARVGARGVRAQPGAGPTGEGRAGRFGRSPFDTIRPPIVSPSRPLTADACIRGMIERPDTASRRTPAIASPLARHLRPPARAS